MPQILYQDDDLIVICKPPGLLSQPGRRPEKWDSVISRLKPIYPDAIVVHRLDEPTSGLDPIGAAEFDDLIATLQKTLGLTVFMVTHDLDSLYSICDRIAVMDADGRLLRQFELTVTPSSFNAREAQAAIKRLIPSSDIRVQAQGKGLILTGTVGSFSCRWQGWSSSWLV